MSILKPEDDQRNEALIRKLSLERYELDATGNKRNQRQNAKARLAATSQLLRQYAIYNGVYPPKSKEVNFGFIRASFDRETCYYGIKVINKNLVVIPKTTVFPVMLLEAYLDSYIQERRKTAVGLLLYYGKILPILFNECRGIYIGKW